MWWIALVVVGFIALIIIIAVAAKSNHERGDHRDGGGTQVGGSERIPFFTPANDRAGMYGEKLVNYHLRPLLREDEYLLANILLPLRNGHKTEIDSILVSRKGIFCIETKNWVGHISGNDEDEYWLQEYDDPCMNDRQHRNPVKQNEGHCAVLERMLNNRFEVYGAVIFAELEDGYGINSSSAFTIREFKNYFRELSEDEIKPEELKLIYQKLLRFVATEEELKQHRDEVRRSFGNN